MSDISAEVEALAGLHTLLGKAVEALKQPQMQLHLVIIAESGPPEIKTVETEDACVKAINQLLKQKEEDPESNIYVHLFEGKRWSLVKGISPGFKCGDRFIPFKSMDGSDCSIDASGSLS